MKEGQANFELMIELEELEAAKEEAMKEAKEISQKIHNGLVRQGFWIWYQNLGNIVLISRILRSVTVM